MSDKREKDALISKARHNLKNPVNAILGFSEMLIEDCEDEGYDDLLIDLKKINSAGKEVLSIIEESFSDSNLNISGSNVAEIATKLEISIRTPLNTIVGYSELLREDTENIDIDTFNEDLDKIIISGQAISNEIAHNNKIMLQNMKGLITEMNKIQIEKYTMEIVDVNDKI